MPKQVMMSYVFKKKKKKKRAKRQNEASASLVVVKPITFYSWLIMVSSGEFDSSLKSSEISFPRGGASALTPLEIKEISNEATKDVLFETSNKRANTEKISQPSKRSKKNKKPITSHEEQTDGADFVPIENFNFKNMVPGTVVLGQVTHIEDIEVTLTVGDNLVGYIPITSVSKEVTRELESAEVDDQSDGDDSDDNNDDERIRTATLSSGKQDTISSKNLFVEGQWLRAIVAEPKSTNKNKRLEFTVEPEILNVPLADDLLPGNVLQCSVSSIEDRGIVLNTGIMNVSGFISNDDLKDFRLKEIKCGSVILATIIKIPSERSLTMKPAEVNTNLRKTNLEKISSVDAIQPGLLVDALVESINKNGLVVKVFGLVYGTLNLANLGEFEFSKLNHRYTIGSVIKARITAVLLKGGVKKCMLTQLLHIISLSKNPLSTDDFDVLEAFPIGYIFEKVIICGGDSNYMYADIGSSRLVAQIHNSKIDPSKVLDIDYTRGTTHTGRVVGYNRYENLLLLSFDPKVLNARYLRISDIPLGEHVKGVVKKILEDSKLVVTVYDNFESVVPKSHLSDVHMAYPERKFKIGSKVSGRVLKKGPKVLYVTLKKSLVTMDDSSVLDSFEKACVGLKTVATVEFFVPNGAIVSFFGNLKAYLPKNEISETFVNKASDFLKVGQTVTVKVLNIRKDEGRLIVTMRQSLELSSLQKSAVHDLSPGRSIVSVVVVDKTKESIIVETDNSNLRGVIFTGQLSDDNYESNRIKYKSLSVGDKLDAVVLDKDLKARTLIMSMKKSLIDASRSGQLPISFNDIKVGDKKLYGFVKSVTSMGLFVSFAGKLTGLVLAKYATDRPNEDLSRKYYKYQSVECLVIRIDEENKRFLLTLKPQGSNGDDFKSQVVENPVDESKKSVGDYFPGVVTRAKIKSIKGTQLNMQLGDNLQGRLEITNCFNDWSEIKNTSQPLSQFHKGDVLEVKVVGYHDSRNHTFLPITHKHSKNVILELSKLEKDIKNSDELFASLDLSSILEGSEWTVFVNNISKGFLWVSLTPSLKGRISFMDLSDDINVFDDMKNKLPIGSALRASVKELSKEHNIVYLKARSKKLESYQDVKIGDKLPAKVLKVKDSYVLVKLSDNIVASAYITDALNDYTDKLADIFLPNDFTTATVLAVDENSEKVAVSLRNANAIDREVNSCEDLKVGQVVRGFVKNVANNGVFVALGRSIHALVRVGDLSDSYLKDWKKYFKPNQLVVGKISSCVDDKRILMTLKESEVNGELSILKRFGDLQVGQIFEGSVKSVTEFGVFVKLDGTMNVSGLCHHSEISDNSISDVVSLFGEGDRVKVKLLSIDTEKKQLSLGMKASYFTDLNQDYEEDGYSVQDGEISDDESKSAVEKDSESGSESEGSFMDEGDLDIDDASDNSSIGHDSNIGPKETSISNLSIENAQHNLTPKTGLSAEGFDWTASILDQTAYSTSDSDEETSTKKRKQSRGHTEDKTADISSRAPQSVDDFERLLIGNPNSSVLWMNYMSFQLQLSEVNKARELAQRALKTIYFREEQEKMNIWVALLNLENSFGTDDTLQETFRLSCQYMDALTMHQKLASILSMSEKFDKLDELYNFMCRKFGSEVSVWVQYGSSLLSRGQNDQARELLSRALNSLSKKDYVEVVKKFAQLEFNEGDSEQGRSLFEGLISDLPKRIDLWNVYIDQEIKTNSREKVEDLFSRVTSKKLLRKQAKFFFNKWLSFEEKNNNESAIAHVKARAADYVRTHQNDE